MSSLKAVLRSKSKPARAINMLTASSTWPSAPALLASPPASAPCPARQKLLPPDFPLFLCLGAGSLRRQLYRGSIIGNHCINLVDMNIVIKSNTRWPNDTGSGFPAKAARGLDASEVRGYGHFFMGSLPCSDARSRGTTGWDSKGAAAKSTGVTGCASRLNTLAPTAAGALA